MPAFYLPAESHTLASALRVVLEEAHPDAFVACTKPHPLDDFLQVDAPSEAALRAALLVIRDRIASTRAALGARARLE